MNMQKITDLYNSGPAFLEGVVGVFVASLNPMEQFTIKPLIEYRLGDIDLSFTNSSLFMMLAVLAIGFLSFLGLRNASLVPGRMQSVVEIAYQFIADMVTNVSGKEGLRYFPFVFSLFVFVLFCNLLGMLPYSFTVTSHIIVTFAMAICVFIGITIIGFIKNGFGYLRMFVPSGVPAIMYVILTPVEIISYLLRPVSLSIRLFANMMAGHALLKVFGGFVVALGVYTGWLPLFFIVAITGLEFLVAFLQAYVFAVLTSIYLNDALNMHH